MPFWTVGGLRHELMAPCVSSGSCSGIAVVLYPRVRDVRASLRKLGEILRTDSVAFIVSYLAFWVALAVQALLLHRAVHIAAALTRFWGSSSRAIDYPEMLAATSQLPEFSLPTLDSTEIVSSSHLKSRLRPYCFFPRYMSGLPSIGQKL